MYFKYVFQLIVFQLLYNGDYYCNNFVCCQPTFKILAYNPTARILQLEDMYS